MRPACFRVSQALFPGSVDPPPSSQVELVVSQSWPPETQWGPFLKRRLDEGRS